MNETIASIMGRHSVRSFTGDSITEADLDAILRAGMAAPSAVNVQPWAFVVVTDRAILARLRDGLPYAKMLDKAACAVIVCGLPGKDERFAKEYWPLDCSAASENILLAAHALGYGAVWTAVFPDESRVSVVRDACKLPAEAIPLNVIPIGVPANRAEKPQDKFRPENLHRNVW